MIELAQPFPKDGKDRIFKYGRAFGTVLGVVAACEIPYHFAAPGHWKRHFRLNSDKEAARALACRLWPSAECFGLKKHHGRAEAALVARYAAETLAELRGVAA
jgi:crossover junction endodeoxyribonuclease RuvC